MSLAKVSLPIKKDTQRELPRPQAPVFDVHTHLIHDASALEKLVRAECAGVKGAVVSIDIFDDVDGHVASADVLLDRFKRLKEALAQKTAELVEAGMVPDGMHLHERLHVSLGIHPYYVERIDEYPARMADLLRLLDDPDVVALGEYGFDFGPYSEVSEDVQLRAFERLLDIAAEKNMPSVLHLRNSAQGDVRRAHDLAYEAIAAHLERTDLGERARKFILHCFTEDTATLTRFCDLSNSIKISFGGAATFKANEGIRDAFINTPLDQMLTETDAPYMTPVPYRGTSCEIAHVVQTQDTLTHMLSDLTGIDQEFFGIMIWESTCGFFDI